jgi:hypothetical protein
MGYYEEDQLQETKGAMVHLVHAWGRRLKDFRSRADEGGGEARGWWSIDCRLLAVDLNLQKPTQNNNKNKGGER